MLTIRSDQLQSLRESLASRQKGHTASVIISQLRAEVPAVMGRYTTAQHQQFVHEVLDATDRLGITDPWHLLNWSYIRFLTDVEFYRKEQFKDILDHPFLHPDSKGRHIVLAFFAVHRMHVEGYRSWPR